MKRATTLGNIHAKFGPDPPVGSRAIAHERSVVQYINCIARVRVTRAHLETTQLGRSTFKKLGTRPGFQKWVARRRSAQGQPLCGPISEQRCEKCMSEASWPHNRKELKKNFNPPYLRNGAPQPLPAVWGVCEREGGTNFLSLTHVGLAREHGNQFGPGSARG